MERKHIKAVIRPLIITLLAWPMALQAADDPVAAAADPVLQQAREASSRQDFAAAAALLRDALARTPANPDYHNLYAYAVRKGPKPNMDLVFKHYDEALRLAPKHRGAHEYIGEAYLMVGNVHKAREHLTQLDRICFFGCEEYSSLKKAIREYEAKGAR
jgi:tetratricopeptide (TPR) repeat protein